MGFNITKILPARMLLNRKQISITILSFILVALCNSNILAEVVSETLPNGVIATAEYRKGDSDKPAVVMLHGFLQTYNFQSTYITIEGVSGLGFAVVAPNLTLGVPNRKRSLQCDAIHQHTLADDLAEIDFWAQWALKKGNKKIIFVGHSWGGAHALAYVAQKENIKDVAGVIAVSLILISDVSNFELQNSQIIQAKILEQNDSKKLGKYTLSFCKDFTGTAESFLSYAEWGNARLLSSLETVSKKGEPVYVILGSADKRFKKEWVTELESAGAKIAVVEGANHFFSAQHEFELIDELEIVLKTLTSGAGN